MSIRITLADDGRLLLLNTNGAKVAIFEGWAALLDTLSAMCDVKWSIDTFAHYAPMYPLDPRD